jgi:hypothetical protein
MLNPNMPDNNMPYNYVTQKNNLFCDEGQKLFLKIRDKVKQHIRQSGAVRMDKILSGISGDSWDMLACIDRMIELGELIELTDPSIFNMSRIFTEPLTD